MEAENRKVAPEVKELAKMMHTEHGKNSADTMELARKLDITPRDTEKTDTLRKKGAKELSELLELDDAAFGPAYVDAMVKGHTEVLQMIDTGLLESAQKDAVKKHFATTREHIAMHLEHAKKLQ